MARTFHVIVPWTYDNIGSQMTDSSVMLNVPYEWFAHTLGATDSVTENIGISDNFGDLSMHGDAHETLTMKGQFTARPNLPMYEPMFISDKLGDPSAKVVVTETLTIGEFDEAAKTGLLDGDTDLDGFTAHLFLKSRCPVSNGDLFVVYRKPDRYPASSVLDVDDEES